ncbi:hypothetical protein Sya03_50390 [Spirilliplanes yamanashiensis]|uniref:Uncharacterized protein n=1 Tax=Spirilliplanes yamanashiensis TaxID=42233 RepID=A0A8J3YDD2_9ACTN|nr:hypothetical protein Sya03_50390 [Spirilliplanes yamanashiensis]
MDAPSEAALVAISAGMGPTPPPVQLETAVRSDGGGSDSAEKVLAGLPVNPAKAAPVRGS